jgi:hypothetical protein
MQARLGRRCNWEGPRGLGEVAHTPKLSLSEFPFSRRPITEHEIPRVRRSSNENGKNEKRLFAALHTNRSDEARMRNKV